MTLLDALLELVGIQVAEAMNGLELGELDGDGWVQQMGQILAGHHLAAFLAGAGDAELDDVGRRYLRRFLGAQFRFLERFGVEIQSADEFQNGWRSRAQMYASAIRAPYEKGRTKVLPLPAMPGDGTTQCVFTPLARVVTTRGLVPICEVMPGDRVLTHNCRWQLVTNIMRTVAKERQGIFVNGVGFTTDHRLYTSQGWQPTERIYNTQLPVYTIPINRYMEDRYAYHTMPGMRRNQGQTGSSMQVMRDEPQSESAVGKYGATTADTDRNTSETSATARSMERHFRANELATPIRWSPVDALLGRRYQTDGVSLSMALGKGARCHAHRACYPSQGWRSDERLPGESGVPECERSQSAPRAGEATWFIEGAGPVTNRGQATAMRMLRQGVCNTNPKEGEPFLQSLLLSPMDAWRHELVAIEPEWRVLPPGDIVPIPDGTILYDIEVDGDHSFIIEDIAAHNCKTNCKCSWEIDWIDRENGDADCYWSLGNAEHCQTCVARARRWNPLRIRGGRIQR